MIIGKKKPITKEVIVLYTDDGMGNSIGKIVGEVVRCKECKWFNPKGDDSYFLCDFWCDNDDGMGNPSPEDYCSLGERREDG